MFTNGKLNYGLGTIILVKIKPLETVSWMCDTYYRFLCRKRHRVGRQPDLLIVSSGKLPERLCSCPVWSLSSGMDHPGTGGSLRGPVYCPWVCGCEHGHAHVILVKCFLILAHISVHRRETKIMGVVGKFWRKLNHRKQSSCMCDTYYRFLCRERHRVGRQRELFIMS